MKQSIVNIIQSPNFLPLTFLGDRFVDNLGNSYKFEKGVAYLYNETDVSPLLKKDLLVYESKSQAEKLDVSDEWKAIEASYRRARGINTNFLFSLLKYTDPSGRKVAEIGVGACDIIRRYSMVGFDSIAVDFYPWEMQEAHILAVDAGEPGFTCISAPMARLPFVDESLDLVYFHAALHHALPRDTAKFRWFDPNNLVDCLSEVRRILKPRDAGGCLFLLGEGIWPEHYRPEDRHHELRVIERNDPYEAWYKISEYEKAFSKSNMFPNIFLWQEDMIAQAFGYSPDGRKVTLVTPEDRISDNNYWQMSELISGNSNHVLPDWIKVRDRDNSFIDSFPDKTNIITGVFTQAGVKDFIDGISVFSVLPGSDGYLLYGPYMSLRPGTYQVHFRVRSDELSEDAYLIFDTVSASGPLCEALSIPLTEFMDQGWRTIILSFVVEAVTDRIETRARLVGSASATVSIVSAVAIETINLRKDSSVI